MDKVNELIEPEKKKAPKHQRPESLLTEMAGEADAAGEADMIQNVKIVKGGIPIKSSSQSKVQRNKVMSDISQITSKKKKSRPGAINSVTTGGQSSQSVLQSIAPKPPTNPSSQNSTQITRSSNTRQGVSDKLSHRNSSMNGGAQYSGDERPNFSGGSNHPPSASNQGVAYVAQHGVRSNSTTD